MRRSFVVLVKVVGRVLGVVKSPWWMLRGRLKYLDGSRYGLWRERIRWVGGWDVEGVEEVVQDEGAQASSSCGCYAELFFWASHGHGVESGRIL
jgi:hypothetical protein